MPLGVLLCAVRDPADADGDALRPLRSVSGTLLVLEGVPLVLPEVLLVRCFARAVRSAVDAVRDIAGAAA